MVLYLVSEAKKLERKKRIPNAASETDRTAMGLLFWKKKSEKSQSEAKPIQSSTTSTKSDPPEVPGMNGAVEVRRPATGTVSVFEFGSVAASADKVTLAGYCPVSDDLEPCRWEILPPSASDAPQFRVVF